MASELIIPPSFHNAVADPAFQQSKVDPHSLAEGVGQSFPVLSIRGKVFRLKYKGEERAILNSETGQPVQSLDVIILKASPVISKIWYENSFVEGQKEAPDCWSTNGLTPDPAAPKKQHNFCASCKQNIWGSKTVGGKAAKACQDNKRLAIVPAHDPRNEMYGGPMLMRIPPASLQDMSGYQTLVQQYGQQYFTTVTRLSFDFDVAHPKIKFAPVAPITGELALTVIELQDHPQVQRMLAEGVEFVKGEEGDQPAPQPATFTGPQAASPPHVVSAPQAPQAPQAPPPPPPPPMPSSAATVQAAGPVTFSAPAPAVVPGVNTVQDAWPAIPPSLDRRTAQTAQPTPEISPPVTFGAPAGTGSQPAANVAPDPTVALLQQQLAEMQQKFAAMQSAPPKRTRKPSNPPPSPQPTAGPPPSAAVASPPAAPSPQTPLQAGITLGAPTPQPQSAPSTDVAEASAGLALPAGMDAELDQLLSKS